MKSNQRPAVILALFLVISCGVQRIAAELPSLDEPPWLGHFAVFENSSFQLGVLAEGKITLTPVNRKGERVPNSLIISIAFGIQEILPGGLTQLKEIKPETLESAEPANAKLEKTVIRGKTTGDASFELIIEQTRGIISFGGRIIEPGSLTKNPLRFVVAVRIPALYKRENKAGDKDLKDFEKKIKDDRIDLNWTDGTRHKHTFEKELNASSKEINGPGIKAAEVDCEAYRNHKFLFTASENSSMALANPKPRPLHEGFSITWTPDTAKDPQGKARLSINVK